MEDYLGGGGGRGVEALRTECALLYHTCAEQIRSIPTDKSARRLSFAFFVTFHWRVCVCECPCEAVIGGPLPDGGILDILLTLRSSYHWGTDQNVMRSFCPIIK